MSRKRNDIEIKLDEVDPTSNWINETKEPTFSDEDSKWLDTERIGLSNTGARTCVLFISIVILSHHAMVHRR